MKPGRGTDSGSCSCTSCLYKSESEQPSIRKYIAHGSRIDRLYYGKYIPLRERKLLNRLVRTRAVYDDLRARLISDSTLSLEKNADLRPGQRHQVIKTLDGNKSGAILELVDIIDKGAPLDAKKLSECCSCCSCSSTSKIIEQNKKRQKGKRTHERTKNARTYEEEYGQMELTGTGEGVYARTYEQEYGRMVPGKIGERYNKRGIRFKAKHIRSDPCTCTFQFSGLIKKHSKAMFRKMRPVKQSFIDIEKQYAVEKPKKQSFARRSFQKYKELQDKLEQDMRKLHESKSNMKQNLKLRAKKSLGQVKHVKTKVKNNIESGVRKSIQAVKALHPKVEPFESVEYPEPETTFKIKKDSIVKFKDYLKRKEMTKDWECDLECKPDICVPEECFKIINLRRLHKRNRQRDRKHPAEHEIIHREVEVDEIPLSKSNSGVQVDRYVKTTATHIRKHKPELRTEGTNEVMEKRLIFESDKVHKRGIKKGTKKIVEKSIHSSLIPATHKEIAQRNIKKKGHIDEKGYSLKEKERFMRKATPHPRGRQAVRTKSSFSFDMKTSRLSQPSGIHMYASRHKRRKVHRRPAVPHVVSKSVEGTPENLRTRLIPTNKYAKAPMTSQQVKLISKISQCACEKRRSNVKSNTDYITKSVTSVTNKPIVATTNKNASKEVKKKERLSQVAVLPAHLDTLKPVINASYLYPKQAVRIGSTFSFNIEFYKKNNQNELEAPSIRKLSNIQVKQTKSKNREVRPLIPETNNIQVKQTRSKNKNVTRKFVQVKGKSVNAYSQAKTTLGRCFCTLKLHEHVKTKKKTKKLETANVTKTPFPSMIDRYVETKKSGRYEEPKYQLLPYECEPGTCIPGECDPILCERILNLKQRRFRRRISKSIGSYTGSRKTKSTSSIMSRSFTSAKAKTVQSSIVPKKAGSTSAPKRYKEYLNWGRNEFIKTDVNASGRQAVRVGSSFSFNIEFYKNKQYPAGAIENMPSLSSMPSEINNKPRKYKKHDNNKQRNKSIVTEVINIDKYIGSSLKRCLCTLKLYKKKATKTETDKKPSTLTANTQTFGEAPIGESVNRGTRTKKEHRYKLLPYECEPYICIPGECDPYICLQKIKRRDMNTRNVSAFTEKPEMKSISSFTEGSFKKSEAVLVQPKLLGKGTNMKANNTKGLYGKPKPAEEILKTSKSKQVVRIGSSFNFSIEFSKQLPEAVAINNYGKNEQYSKIRPKKETDKGITVTKVRVDHVDTQSLRPKKVNRASLVRPMLKRCFCTLNLQKTKQQYRKDLSSEEKYFGPKVYTVGRAATTNTAIISHSFVSQMNTRRQLVDPKNKTISISTSSFLLNKYIKDIKSKQETEKLYSTLKIPIQSKRSIIIKSSVSLKINIIRQLGPSRLCYIKQPEETSSYKSLNEKSEQLKLLNQPSCDSIKEIASISKYLERCFCTMNVQISNQGGMLGKKKVINKLKPYECEPGICVPGECDPYECKKLIMKRLTKHVTKGSGTNSTNKSISSYAVSNKIARLDSKNAQMQTFIRSPSHGTIPQRYKSKRLREPKQRQAVRIKSSFSFDLEFYKYQSQPSEKYLTNVEQHQTSSQIKNRVNPKTHATVGIEAQERKNNGNNIKFQTVTTSVHKGTATAAKRCFCTLKLQKQGRIHRENAKLNVLTPNKTPSTMSRSVKIGTATKHYEVPVDSNDLKLHEKHKGINTILQEKNSVSSMTPGEKHKTRAVKAISKRTHQKSTKTMKSVKSVENGNSYTLSRSSRSAVRIGSNFSFNIEFFKDVPQMQQYKEENLQREKISRTDFKKITDRKELKPKLSLNKKKVSYKAAITESPPSQKLRSIKVPAKTNIKTFKQKCFCVLGLRKNQIEEHKSKEILNVQSKENKAYQTVQKPAKRSKRNKNYQPAENAVQTAKNRTNTNDRQKVLLPYLEPYECEPGICVPGQCNPYLCDKIIQQRLARQYSKRSETESIRTQSVASSFTKNKRSKNEKTQAQGQTTQKQIQYLPKPIKRSQVQTNQNQIQYLSKPSNQLTLNQDKRLVRIGSNFSFNIEFYKENGDGGINKNVEGDISKIKNVQFERPAKKNISTSVETKVPKKLGGSQAKKKTKQSGVNPLLKRCFCTLKLLNKPINLTEGTKNMNQSKTKSMIRTKTAETQSNKLLKGNFVTSLEKNLSDNMLSPFECEPFVCVPGECDPVECLKRIKKRQQQTKQSGTVTEYPKRKSIGNVATKTRNENLQVEHRIATSKKGIQKTLYVDKSVRENSYNQPRQAVRIGSNFSFNIEFFKEIGNDLPKVVTKDIGNDLTKTPANRSLKELHIQKHSKKKSQHQTKMQPPIVMHNVDSQVVPKLQSKETAMARVKRCFCTLPLRNKKLNVHDKTSIKIQSQQPESDHSNVGKFLKKCICTFKINKVGKRQNQLPMPAVKYEIKGTSTHNRRGPQNYNKKLVTTLEPHECEPYFCTPGECDPYECLKRIQQRRNQLSTPAVKYEIKGTSIRNRHAPQNHIKKLVRSLEPYECEPYVCTPGECDPYECLKRIQQRRNQLSTPAVKYKIKGTSIRNRRAPQNHIKKLVRTLEPYECEPYVCTPGECDPYECLKRIQRRQVRDFGTDYKRYVKDSATDSIKQPATRSTEAQYHQKRKLSSRGTSSAAKRTRRSSAQFSSQPHLTQNYQNNSNRQVVRIGSNFSFNVEFFKDHVAGNTERRDNKQFIPNKKSHTKISPPEKPRTKFVKTVKSIRDKKSQYSNPERLPMYSKPTNTPKRCFCTLNLLQKPRHPKSEEKLMSPSITTKDKMTATKIKYAVPQELGVYECPPLMCIPGECNPYECLEKIKRREVMRKHRNVGTRATRMSPAAVGNRGLILRAHKVQSQVPKRRNAIVSTPHSEPQSEILKSSRTIESSQRRNKRAVRIGSNFNFNVEFFKQKSQPAVISVPKITNARGSKEHSKSYLNKNVTAGAGIFRNYSSQVNKKLQDQASDTGNLLKRCFCTLQLQKPTGKKSARLKIHNPGNNVRYPQTFTVGRVAVEPFIMIKSNPWKKIDKARSTSIDPRLLNRTVGTKTNKKYLRNMELSSSHCNPSNCQNDQKTFFRRKSLNDMQTILPYTPSKFHKKDSRTRVLQANKPKKVHALNELHTVSKPSCTSMLSKGKRRLTAKRSKNSLKTTSNLNDSFFCRCVRFFSRKYNTRSMSPYEQNNRYNLNKRIQLSRTDRQPANIKFVMTPKKAENVYENGPETTNKTWKRHSKLQNRNTENSIIEPCTNNETFYNKETKSQRGGKNKHPQMKVTFADTSGCSRNHCLKRKINQPLNKYYAESKLCYSCSTNDCPFKSNNLKNNQLTSGDFHSLSKSMKSNKKLISYSESVDDCQFCKCCKRKIDTDEISKGGGDRRLISNERKYSLREKFRLDNLIRKNQVKKCSSKIEEAERSSTIKEAEDSSKIKPLFEMRLDTVDHDIINKTEVQKKLAQLSKVRIKDSNLNQDKIKHDSTCACCKCLKKKKNRGATIFVPAKGAINTLDQFRKKSPKTKTTIPIRKYRSPCICGSIKCAVESKIKKLERKKDKMKFGKTCVCGSSICTTESKRILRKKQAIAAKRKKNIKDIVQDKERDELNRLIKIQDDKDNKRRLKRIKRNKELEGVVKEYKHASDVMLAVQSLIDIGRLGVSSIIDLLRGTTKTISNPKMTYAKLCQVCKRKDRESLVEQIEKEFTESDTKATMQRLKMRLGYMKRFQSLRQRLEENRFTHYLLHVADKNEKTRQFKRKPVRHIREPLDFQCSLYMATLRKRPYLCVYYRCPWFYPHFMTIVTIWRQFTDIVLFLLAAVVWSPCILCMEGCRAVMCCFFCTG